MAPTDTRSLQTRLAPFIDRGLIDGVPTRWQLLLGSIEMAPYVVLPDDGDAARYAGAPLGHPLARTPLVLSQIGWEHFRIGHGLGASLRALIRHLAYVYHEGMPTYDLQLVQTHAGGLDELRRAFERTESGGRISERKDRLLTSWVIPDASAYRRGYLEPGGHIDRAAAFDYPEPPEMLRPEFASVCSFCNYCLHELEPAPPRGARARAETIATAARARFGESGDRDPGRAFQRLFGSGSSRRP